MLHPLLQLALLVLRDIGVPFAPPEQFDTVAADIADRHARLRGVFPRPPRQLPPPLLVQIRNRTPDYLPLGLPIDPEPCFPDRLVYGLDHDAVPYLDRDHPRLRYADIGQLIERHGSAIGTDGDR